MRRRVLFRFALRFVLLAAFATLSTQGFAVTLTFLLALSAVLLRTGKGSCRRNAQRLKSCVKGRHLAGRVRRSAMEANPFNGSYENVSASLSEFLRIR